MKKLLAGLLALCCLSNSPLLVSARVVDNGDGSMTYIPPLFDIMGPDWQEVVFKPNPEVREAYVNYYLSRPTIEGENYICDDNDGMTWKPWIKAKPESGIKCKANCLVIGAYTYINHPELDPYPVYLIWVGEGNYHTVLSSIYLEKLGMDSEAAYNLNVGDLVYWNDVSEINKAEYCGNALDIYGDDFIKVLEFECGFDFMANSFRVNPYEYIDISYTLDEVAANAEAKKSGLQLNPVQTPVAKGDVSGDEEINILDAITINRVVLGKEVLTEEQSQAADLDGNGSVDAADSLILLKYLIGLIDEL